MDIFFVVFQFFVCIFILIRLIIQLRNYKNKRPVEKLDIIALILWLLETIVFIALKFDLLI